MAKHTKIVIFLVVGYFVLTASECKKATDPDSAPYISTREPSAYTLNQKIGDTINFSVTATDADEDAISYKTLKDGSKVNDSNTFEFIIDELGSFLIQIVAYNAEADTAEWQVNVENEPPVIGSLSNNTAREDEVVIGSTVNTISVTDNEDLLEELTIELSQTNSDLIKFGLDDDHNIVVEDYAENGNGSSTVTVKVTDSHGEITEKSFIYNITPMTDIEGSILDSDTWEPNTSLQGFVIISGDTVWADATGEYKTQIDPQTNIDIEGGYRSLDKTQPMSFITTARGVLAGNDISDADIMVATYLNNNMTPEEFRTMAWETNFGDGNYLGAIVPSTSMTDKIVLSGNPAIDWKNEEYIEEMTDEEIADIKRIIADSINVHLKHPFPLEETVYYEGIFRSELNVVTWEKKRWANPSVPNSDVDNDGIIDYVNIVTSGIHEGYYDAFISALLEEGFGSRGQYFGAKSPELEGKTIAYEYVGIEWIYAADIKFIKFVEGVAHEVGYLKPKMPIDDVFKIQE